MTKKKTRIVFGKGNFICPICGFQYSKLEKSDIIVEDEDGYLTPICNKGCKGKIDPDDYERLYRPFEGYYFKKRTSAKKVIYLIQKKFKRKI